jgi:hypothetical protein
VRVGCHGHVHLDPSALWQLLHSHAEPGGGRVLEVLAVNGIDGGEIVHVDQEDADLEHVLVAAAHGSENDPEIFEDLVSFVLDGGIDEFALLVERDLSRDVADAAIDLCDRIGADGLGTAFRVEGLDRHYIMD